MKYAVTFCSMDTRVDANPMWHSCILLSKMDEELHKLEVVDTWGFYGVPSTGTSNVLAKTLKRTLKIDIDLQGNHGKWCHEETRHLDQGQGLHGKTYELTEEQFTSLSRHLCTMHQEEDAAIEEIAQFLTIEPKTKPRIYAYEQYSHHIFSIEKVRAGGQKRDPRLKPFEVQMGYGLGGPHLRNATTCKTQTLSALRTVLSAEQIAELTEYGKHPSVPKYSGIVEDIYLHSTGPLSSHIKRSGEKVHYRQEIGKAGVRVFWTVPPQNVNTLTKETALLLTMDPMHCAEIKKLVSKLQRLEWALHNAAVPSEYQARKERLIRAIVNCYQEFSLITPRLTNENIAGFTGFALRLFSLPRSEYESLLMERKNAAKILLNCIYMAIVDDWQIDTTSSSQEDAFWDVSSQDTAQSNDPEDLDEWPESIAAYLAEKDKIAICTILGRAYVAPEPSEVDYSSSSDDEFVADVVRRNVNCSVVGGP